MRGIDANCASSASTSCSAEIIPFFFKYNPKCMTIPPRDIGRFLTLKHRIGPGATPLHGGSTYNDSADHPIRPHHNSSCERKPRHEAERATRAVNIKRSHHAPFLREGLWIAVT